MSCIIRPRVLWMYIGKGDTETGGQGTKNMTVGQTFSLRKGEGSFATHAHTLIHTHAHAHTHIGGEILE